MKNNKKRNTRENYAIVEAEREFLAQMLSGVGDDPATAIINRYGPDVEKYFVDDGNKVIFHAMLELAKQNQTIDCVTIAMLLLNKKQINRVDCIAQLTAIQDDSSYSLPINVRTYTADEQLAKMHDLWVRRQLKKIATNEHI